MKPIKTTGKKILMTALCVCALIGSLVPMATPVSASGGATGGGGGSFTKMDAIKVNKCYYFDTGSYVELLINAVSSNSAAHLYAYLPDGIYLGEVQNGGGGRYGGTVFLTLQIPSDIIIISSSGGVMDAPCVPGQI